MSAVRTKFWHKLGLLILSLVLTLVLLELGLRMAGKFYLLTQELRNRFSQSVSHGSSGREYRILCLGESTTAFGGEEAYPRQLEKILNSRGSTKFTVINKGIPATTTNQIVSHLEDYLKEYKPNVVVVMMGVNDTKSTPTFHDSANNSHQNFFMELKTVRLFYLLQQHLGHLRKDIAEGRSLDKELRALQAAISRNPSSENYVKIAKSYGRLKEFQKQKEALEKALVLSPGNYAVYIQLAEYYKNSGEMTLAEQQYQKALSLPEIPQVLKLGLLSALADCYFEEQKYSQAEAIYHKLLSVFPQSAKSERVLLYDLLADVYIKEEKFSSAADIFAERISVDPKGIPAYLNGAYAYRKLKRFDELEQILKKAIAVHSADTEHYFFLYSELGYCLLDNNKYSQAKDVFEHMMAMDPQDKGEIRVDVNYGMNLAMDAMAGKAIRANFNSHISKESYYLPATIENYLRLKEIVLRRGIKFVAVQYPMRQVAPLKEILQNDPHIIFVDNEGVFKKAVAESAYADYFVDHFGGDFGHCTAKGNYLLAEHVASAILEAAK